MLQANTAFVQLKALVAEYSQKAYDPMDKAAVGMIEKFESKLPAYKGMIPKTLGNLVLFICYKAVVLYVLLKVILFALRMVFGITSCVVCCICCCRCGRSKQVKKAAKNGKAAPTNGKAAPTNGKAATPAVKAAAKQATKGKK